MSREFPDKQSTTRIEGDPKVEAGSCDREAMAPSRDPLPSGGAQKRWSLSTPTSPLPRDALQVLGGSGSRLAPYNPGGGSIFSSSPTIRPIACRKIRNDISAEEKEEISMAFKLFDSRQVGKHHLRDLKAAMRALEFPVKKAECRKLIDDYCKDGSDEIDQEEFMEILTAKYQERDPDEDLAKAFRFFDEDNTGKISLKNLRKIARELGEHITDDELAAMIDEFDRDGDGESESPKCTQILTVLGPQKLKYSRAI